jgi:DNA-binding LacI/PurR family transcriptional regulator
MREVAQLASVSVQTVSCVVNGTGSISPETRERVQQAIEQLNYHRDPIARSMRTGRTQLIGLLVLDITNPVLSLIASAVEAEAYTRSYGVLLYNVSLDKRREQAYLKAVAERLVDGLIIVNAVDRDKTFTDIQKSAFPTVLIDCLATPAIPSVSVDNQQGAYLATSHLAQLGHQRIAHLSGAPALEVAQQRILGYQQALSDYGLAYNQVIHPLNNRWDYRSGYVAMQQLLQTTTPPTAVFVAGDQMAVGAYRALAEAGVRVPDDMSVIGFDDIEAASYITPSLTTIRQPFEEMGQRALALLFELLNSGRATNRQVILPPELILRQSTGRVP